LGQHAGCQGDCFSYLSDLFGTRIFIALDGLW
jgi:hypothetical protein